MLNAVITAAGRLGPEDAQRYGSDIKALVRIGGRSLLAIVIEALRGVPEIGRVTVVGPRTAQACGAAADRWIDEQASGEENVLAALRDAGDERVVFCASDMPFVRSASIAGLLAASPPSADCVYPIFTREEFEAAYPGARSSFARLSDGQWTGGSALVVNAGAFLRNEQLVRKAFGARKSLVAMASLLGPQLALRYAANKAGVADVKARIERLTRGSLVALRGADPALAMDCDEAADFEYARVHAAQVTVE